MSDLHSVEEDEQLIFLENGSRPTVDDPGLKGHKFLPTDEVVIIDPRTRQKEGPYQIEQAEKGRYSLCDENGKTVKSGKLFEESELVAYDPFA